MKSFKKSGLAFTNFVKKEFLPNILKFAAKVAIKAFSICFAIEVAKQKIPDYLSKAIQAVMRSKSLNYIEKVVKIFSSTGNIIAFIQDCFDGNVNEKFEIYGR